MRIGLLSDSHGRIPPTRAAVQALAARGAELLLYMGDIGSEQVIDELAGHNARLVFGNTDDNIPALTRYAQFLGIAVDHPAGDLELSGKRIVYTHGHLADVMQRAITDRVDYLIHGHTHEPRDERIGGTRVINPGALHRATRYTAAVLDIVADKLDFIVVPRS